MKTEQPKRYIKCLVVVYVVSGLVYMGWRVGTINMSAPLFSIPLYAAELTAT